MNKKQILLLVLCTLLLFGFTYTYDTATPAGTDDPAEADDRMREIKAAIQERLTVEHYFELTGTEVSDSNTGKHKDVTADSLSIDSVVYDIRTYGASTASADNSTAIQAALDAANAAGGGIVFIPEGTWAITSVLTMNMMNVSLVGASMNASIIDDNSGSGDPTLFVNSSGLGNPNYTLLADFKILGNATSGAGIKITGDYVHVDRVHLLECGSYGLWLYGNTITCTFTSIRIRDCDAHGIMIESDSSFHPNANVFMHCSSNSADGATSDGLHISKGNGTIIIGGTLEGNGRYGLYIDDADETTLLGTWFEGNGTTAIFPTSASGGSWLKPVNQFGLTEYSGVGFYSAPSRNQVLATRGILSDLNTATLLPNLMGGFGNRLTFWATQLAISSTGSTLVDDNFSMWGKAMKMSDTDDKVQHANLYGYIELLPGDYRAYFHMRSDAGTGRGDFEIKNTTDNSTLASLNNQTIANGGDEFYALPAGGLAFTIGTTDVNDSIRIRFNKDTGTDNILLSHITILPNYLSPPLNGTLVWDPASLADGAGETSSGITVTGVALGDYVMVAAPYDLQDCIATGYVQAANTVEIRLQNESTGTIDLASGTWKVRVIK